ncbi:MAG: HU family DNA-binding protein [Desulfobacterales bacterium]|jgi:integration host factor subunit beta
MNKLELTETLREKTELTKSEAKAVVKLFFKEMSNALAKGDRVEIRGLCSFYVKKYKAYAGRNPKSGEPTRVKPKKLPFFKVGKELRDRANS